MGVGRLGQEHARLTRPPCCCAYCSTGSTTVQSCTGADRPGFSVPAGASEALILPTKKTAPHSRDLPSLCQQLVGQFVSASCPSSIARFDFFMDS